jgi:hypothetical protein
LPIVLHRKRSFQLSPLSTTAALIVAGDDILTIFVMPTGSTLFGATLLFSAALGDGLLHKKPAHCPIDAYLLAKSHGFQKYHTDFPADTIEVSGGCNANSV